MDAQRTDALSDCGFGLVPERAWREVAREGREPARVTAQYRDRYRVRTACGERDAEVLGALRYVARGREDFPVVGDWVALAPRDDGISWIEAVVPRTSLLSRSLADGPWTQPVAANVDLAFLVQGLGRDLSPNRLERYLTLCAAARIDPAVVFTKADLLCPGEAEKILEGTRRRFPGIPVLLASGLTGEGASQLPELLGKGRTGCLLGSSGAGKSTLLNRLLGVASARTGEVSVSTGKGCHVTVRRELFELPSGAFLIDNPGMREVGIGDASAGREGAFARIAELSRECRFRDCRHLEEAGCAVRAALDAGSLEREAFANFLKARGEQEHYDSTLEERRRRDRDFGRLRHAYKKGR